MTSSNVKYGIFSLLILAVLLASFIFSTIFLVRRLARVFQEPQPQPQETNFNFEGWEKVKSLVDRPKL